MCAGPTRYYADGVEITPAEYERLQQAQQAIEMVEMVGRQINSLALNPIMLETARDLRSRGYLLAVCTNNFLETGASVIAVQEVPTEPS